MDRTFTGFQPSLFWPDVPSIGLKENLQETPIFGGINTGFPLDFPLNQPIELLKDKDDMGTTVAPWSLFLLPLPVELLSHLQWPNRTQWLEGEMGLHPQ